MQSEVSRYDDNEHVVVYGTEEESTEEFHQDSDALELDRQKAPRLATGSCLLPSMDHFTTRHLMSAKLQKGLCRTMLSAAA